MFGADPGRSGFSTSAPLGLFSDDPLGGNRAWDLATVASTPPVISAGVLDDQRVTWGTADGEIDVHRLSDGTGVGKVDVSDADGPFGVWPGGVGLLSVSSSEGPGQVLSIHNDTTGVGFARVDEARGTLVADEPLPGLDGHRVTSSPVAYATAQGQVVFFVAATGATERLVRLTLSPGLEVTAVSRSADLDLTVAASPALAWLPTASGSVLHVVAGASFAIVTIPVDDDTLNQRGPSAKRLDGPVQTPSVLPDGGIVVAVGNGSTGTVVRTLRSDGSSLVPTATAGVSGAPAPALAVAPKPGPLGTVVYVTTANDLVALRAGDLEEIASDFFVPGRPDLPAPPGEGYSRSTVAVAGDLVFAVDDRGTLQPLTDTLADATPNQPLGGPGFGQPAISGSHIVVTTPYQAKALRRLDPRPLTGQMLLGRDGGTFARPWSFEGPNEGLRCVFSEADRRKAPFVSLAAPTNGRVCWGATAAGDVVTLQQGNENPNPYYGSVAGTRLRAPIVGIEPEPSNFGYWLVAGDGGVFAFGAAAFHGSAGNLRLRRPIVGMAPRPTGWGYWLAASDGGVFSYGDAQFHGSTGGLTLRSPVVAIAATPTGNGYWLAAADGGVFAFGDAGFHGSGADFGLRGPIVSMVASSTGKGYVLVAADGAVFAFGDAPFMGSHANMRLGTPIVDVVAR